MSEIERPFQVGDRVRVLRTPTNTWATKAGYEFEIREIKNDCRDGSGKSGAFGRDGEYHYLENLTLLEATAKAAPEAAGEPKRADPHAGPTAAQVREAYAKPDPYSGGRLAREAVIAAAMEQLPTNQAARLRNIAALAREMQESSEERRRRLLAPVHPGRNFALERYK